MKRLVLILLLCTQALLAGKMHDVQFGMHAMFGGRYDDMRMCVASPAGAKGGIIADVMLDIRYPLKNDHAVVVNIPVMRPLLFGFAFKMLQFEPQVAFEKSVQVNDAHSLLLSPGLGVSLHYGPDYTSEKNNRGSSFFAAGPYLSGLCAIRRTGSSGKPKAFGVRVFYVPLMSKDRGCGTVVGGALEGHFSFTK